MLLKKHFTWGNCRSSIFASKVHRSLQVRTQAPFSLWLSIPVGPFQSKMLPGCYVNSGTVPRKLWTTFVLTDPNCTRMNWKVSHDKQLPLSANQECRDLRTCPCLSCLLFVFLSSILFSLGLIISPRHAGVVRLSLTSVRCGSLPRLWESNCIQNYPDWQTPTQQGTALISVPPKQM